MLRLYLDAGRRLVRVVDLGAVPAEFDVALLPPVEPGQVVEDVDAPFPDFAAVDWTGTAFVAKPAAAPASISKERWRRRFTPAEQVAVEALRKGWSPATLALDESAPPVLLTRAETLSASLVLATYDDAAEIVPQVAGAPNARVQTMIEHLIALGAIAAERASVFVAPVGSIATDTGA